MALKPVGPSLRDLVTTLEELNHLGVGFVSLTEALDLTRPTGRASDSVGRQRRRSNRPKSASYIVILARDSSAPDPS
jgi:DNA invertase Pin-like site-specific DNA recombinase